MTTIRHCRLKIESEDELDSVIEAARQTAVCCDIKIAMPIRLDLSICPWLNGGVVSMLASTILLAKARGIEVRIDPPPAGTAAREVFDRSNLGFLDRPYSVESIRLSTGDWIVPVLRHQRASFRDADPILNLANSNLPIDDDSQEGLRLCVNELIQNAQDHAASPTGSVVAAQLRFQPDRVCVGVVDRGRGIEESLRSRYPTVSRHSALRWVVEGRYSALSRQNNAGLGINLVKTIISTHGGRILMLSGDSGFRFSGEEPEPVAFFDLPFRFEGTGVFFTYPLLGTVV